MVAARHYDVDDLNARARAHRQNAGTLTGPILEVDGRPYQAGDRVMTLRNHRRLGVRNGTFATITASTPTAATLTIRTDQAPSIDSRPRISTPATSVTRYATTIHKAQGITVDQALVLGNDTLYQEAGYVALSRGRHREPDLPRRPRTPTRSPRRKPPTQPVEALTQALGVSHAQRVAVDSGIDRDAIRRGPFAPHTRAKAPPQPSQRLPAVRHAYEIESLTTMRQQNVENIARNYNVTWWSRSTRNAAGDNVTTERGRRVVAHRPTSAPHRRD